MEICYCRHHSASAKESRPKFGPENCAKQVLPSTMEYLQVWLLVVGFLRIVGAANGAFFLKNIKERVYGGSPLQGFFLSFQ